MGQNRDAPAYQEYAATILAQLPFRTMTLQERGLLYTMRLECWVNVRLPHNHIDLAKVLGVPISEVTESLAAVMPFFKVADNFVICPELENYRAHLAERKLKQSQGGKVGSKITNQKRNIRAEPYEASSTTSSNLRVPRRATRVSLVQSSTEQSSQNQLSGEAVDPFVAEYEAAESCTADVYSHASEGR